MGTGNDKPNDFKKTATANIPPADRLKSPANGFVFLMNRAAIPGMNRPSAIISEAKPRVLIIELNFMAIRTAKIPAAKVAALEYKIRCGEDETGKISLTRVSAPRLMAVSAVDMIAAAMPRKTRIPAD